MQKVCLITLSLIAVSIANATIVQHLTFDVDGTASVGTDATLVGGATIVTGGKAAGALSLDGIDDYATTIGYKGIGGSDPRTISLWVKTAVNQSAGTFFIGWGDVGSGARVRYDLGLQGGTTDQMRLELNSGGFTSATGTTITDNTWHHLALTWDGTTVTFYLDGNPYGTAAPGTVNTVLTEDVVIGTGIRQAFGGNTTARWTDGLIDDVQIYDEALDAAKIEFLYNNPGNPYQDNDLDPAVDAGLNYITWLDNGTVPLAGTVDDHGEADIANADVVWSIETSPAGSAAVLTKASTDWANPTADFTPDTTLAGGYTIRLTATDTSGQSGTDTLVVQVADNACQAAQLDPEWTGFSIYDVNENCIIDLPDVTAFAIKWLGESSLSEPLAY